jgi:hypothetical protein
MEKTKVSWEQVKELLPERVSLYDVDYNDSLDDHTDVLQECIHERSKDKLYEKTDEWYEESPFSAFEYYDKEIKSSIENAFDVDSEEAEEIFEELESEIRDELYNRDDSNVIKDLLRNTRDFAMFYDTGYEVPEGSWAWDDKQINRELKDIKRVLGIKIKDTTWDEQLGMMVRQASYGGQLVIYFCEGVEDFLEIGEQFNMINFRNAHVAIIDTYHGAGDHCHLSGSDITLPLDTSNLYICKAVKYSYTHDVCGMYNDWCAGTSVQFLTKKTRRVAAKSSLAAQQEREKQYQETYRKGGCTAGDMNFGRHRNTEYINHFPCGTKCKNCGTFWID